MLDTIPTDSYTVLLPTEQVAACTQLARLEARVKAHQMAAARAAQDSDAADAAGATSTESLLAGSFGGDPGAAKRLLGQGKRISQAGATADALARGDVSLQQAELIAKTIKHLPGDPSAQQREACETQLLDDAPTLSLKDLSRRADRSTDWGTSLHEVLGGFAPDEVDAHEDKTITDRENTTWAKTQFVMWDQRDGTHKGTFVIPERFAEMLKNALDAISAPQVQKEDPEAAVLEQKPTYAQKFGWAFCTLIEHIPADKLPDTAGVGATMTINLDYDVLLGAVQAVTLSTGCRISASEARRMACELRLLPQVFNGESLPLDHGRARRFFTTAQRRAAEKRDKGCTFPGNGGPPAQSA